MGNQLSAPLKGRKHWRMVLRRGIMVLALYGTRKAKMRKPSHCYSGVMVTSDGKGSTLRIESSVFIVKTLPSVSRTTGPNVSADRRHPSPARTANTGMPPSRIASLRSVPKRAALSRAVPPSLACLHSRMAFRLPAASCRTKSGDGFTVRPNFSTTSW